LRIARQSAEKKFLSNKETFLVRNFFLKDCLAMRKNERKLHKSEQFLSFRNFFETFGLLFRFPNLFLLVCSGLFIFPPWKISREEFFPFPESCTGIPRPRAEL
jgi:hypothetical protein